MTTPLPGRLKRVASAVRPSLFVLAIAVVLTVRLGAFIWRYSVNVLFYDQWDFLTSFFDHDPSVAELFFLQHGPHREGIGLIADKFLYPLTGWNVRVESLMIGGCVAAAMALALLLKKRLFGRLDYWDALIPMIFLTLAQYDTFLFAPNPAYSGFPVLLLMLTLLALLQRNDVMKYGAVLAINYLLIYTGFGVFMGVVTIGLFVVLCYRRWRGFVVMPLAIPIVGLLIACVSFASFFLHYTFQSAVDCFVFPDPRPGNYAWFEALLFANVTGVRSPILLVTALGTILFLFAIFVFGVQLKGLTRVGALNQTALTIAILSSYSLLFAVNTAVGRVCLGLPGAAQQTRYTTLLIPAFLAMYLYLRAAPPGRIRTIALAVLVVVLIPGHVHVNQNAAYYADKKRAWVACYRETEDIGACDALTRFRIYPDPQRTRLKEKLDYLKIIQANLFAE